MSEIRSEMSATVWKIEKAVGDTIAPGEVIMILESMKMEIPIEAEDAGTITSLDVAEGDSIEDEQLLAVVD
ncbi:biotin/lipoyl-binding carrier protein [Rhodococcus fascians]|nr:biotin/lipoyl-binding carrier protein [Rhodococcus fascians]MBY4238362.1 biotin/lipoyl-binding carrier protein [Rhodococcus fascians]MBY4254257.1 biotin/lipoyl-binding carrier protein [Rhodococcus fascians]MBY4269638.1 biotin/lipoyl-binding carrier protein [Rhodococcus fascians]